MKTLGITIRHLDKDLFSNGATQHIYTMAKLFKQMGWQVYLISHMKTIPKENNNFMDLPIKTRYELNEMMEQYKKTKQQPIHFKLDLFMCFEWYVKYDWFDLLKKTFNCKLVKYQPGNLYETLEEKYLSDADFNELNNYNETYPETVDAIWVSPHYESRIPIYDILYRAKSSVFPYLWESDVLVNELVTNSKSVVPTYENTLKKYDNQFSIGICEPNRDILKSTFLPLIGALNATKTGLIHKINIFVSKDIKNGVVNTLSTVKYPTKWITYNSRTPITSVLNISSIVLCHQFDHMLNYVYLEVPFFGFPLIHNSPMCKDIGYYYKNIDEIPSIIEHIKHHHNADEYLKKNNEFIKNYSINNPDNISKIKQLISSIGL